VGVPRRGTSPLSEHTPAAVHDVAGWLDAHARGAPVTLATSGTSGPPRAVVRTTESWVRSFGHVSRLTGIGLASQVWVPGPMTATMNLFAAVHAEVAGAVVVGTPERATHAHLTPSALVRCLDEHAPLDGVTVVVAGDRLSPGLAARATGAGCRIHHYYGAAELSFVAWGGHAEDLTPFPEVDLQIHDEEIWVRSPYVCTGYDGPPGALRRDGDGYATVGDRGRREGDRLLVFGRPDAVTTGGATVLVADVEEPLRSAARGEVVVLGVPHHALGTVLAAALTDPGDRPRLRERAATMPPSHRPRMWFCVPRLPLTDAGKTDRPALLRLVISPDATRLV
jgi:long-chain acyl-CoA synthetase